MIRDAVQIHNNGHPPLADGDHVGQDTASGRFHREALILHEQISVVPHANVRINGFESVQLTRLKYVLPAFVDIRLRAAAPQRRSRSASASGLGGCQPLRQGINVKTSPNTRGTLQKQRSVHLDWDKNGSVNKEHVNP